MLKYFEQKEHKWLFERRKLMIEIFGGSENDSSVHSVINNILTLKRNSFLRRNKAFQKNFSRVENGVYNDHYFEMEQVYSELSSIGINADKYIEFLMQINAPRIYDAILAIKGRQFTKKLKDIFNQDYYDLKRRRDLANVITTSNGSFYGLAIFATGVAVALGRKKFVEEIVPDIDDAPQELPRVKIIQSVNRFISQTKEQIGISLEEPALTFDLLTSRLQLAFSSSENSSSIMHFLFENNKEAFKGLRRCPLPDFAEKAFTQLGNSFQSQSFKRRFQKTIKNKS